MPIYEYKCQHCGAHTEILQKVSESPTVTCPHCQQNTLAKLVSAPSFQLKGSGWYATDFRDKKKESEKKNEEKPVEKTEKKDGATE